MSVNFTTGCAEILFLALFLPPIAAPGLPARLALVYNMLCAPSFFFDNPTAHEEYMEALYTFQELVFKQVLCLPSLVLPRGGVTTLFGPSGCGKTTLLRLLNKLASPTGGRLLYQGRPMEEIDTVALRREVSLLSQSPVIFEGRVRENLLAGIRFQGREAPGDERLRSVLEEVRLSVPLDGPTAHLSGGERQRLALARLLLLDSPVYLLDEPSAALDGETAAAVVAMLAGWIRRGGKTLLFVTHSAALARAHSNRIIHMEAGRVTRQEELA